MILAAVAVGSYFIGYKTAYDRMEDGSARQTILPQTFYGEITEISGDLLSIDGLDVNDINYRDAFTFRSQRRRNWYGAARRCSWTNLMWGIP